MSHPLVIDLKDVHRIFQTDEIETHALSGIELQVRRGEYLSISGPSGSGKSTLLSILGLLDRPSKGSYRLGGEAVDELNTTELARLRNREIGFVFQNFNLIGDLTVAENVDLPLSYRGLPRGERRQRVDEALERVNMAHRRNHYPGQLSGGQQQRVAVARAIVSKPALLLADEPTGNLDSANGEAVMELLHSLHEEGATICMVTHNPEYARKAQRDIHLFDGQIVTDYRHENGTVPA